MLKIAMTEFAKRHFTAEFQGTKILDITPDEFTIGVPLVPAAGDNAGLVDGYAPFCKHLFVKNFTGALAGVAEITPDNVHLLKSGYKARRSSELPVLSRWFVGVEAPKARCLDIILYSAEQLKTEGIDIGDASYGIVSINATMIAGEEPMPPTTMLRNAIGIAEGGSGVPLDHKKYIEAVEFWENHAIVA